MKLLDLVRVKITSPQTLIDMKDRRMLVDELCTYDCYNCDEHNPATHYVVYKRFEHDGIFPTCRGHILDNPEGIEEEDNEVYKLWLGTYYIGFDLAICPLADYANINGNV